MTNVKISIHKRNLDKRLEGLKNWKIADEDKKDLVRFLNDYEIGKVNKGKRIGETRRLKCLENLKPVLEFFNKPISNLELADVEKFEKAIITNKLKSKKNKPYSDNSKKDIRIGLKIYLKWKLGEAKALELCGWVDTRVPNKTPDYLSEQEIEKLYRNCKNEEERFLIAVLFDSGARAEEFHNIRYEDIQLPKLNENFVKLTLKEEYSKTKGRVISLFWKYSLDAVREYLNERIKEGIKNNDPIFRNTYDNSRQILYRLGKKVLNKSIHYHLFRHSSSTYYATKLNRQELCYRYGWAFSSRMPDVYISRAGMENKQLDEKFTSTELEDLKKELDRERQKNTIQLIEVEKRNEEKFEEFKKEVLLSIKNKKRD